MLVLHWMISPIQRMPPIFHRNSMSKIYSRFWQSCSTMLLPSIALVPIYIYKAPNFHTSFCSFNFLNSFPWCLSITDVIYFLTIMVLWFLQAIANVLVANTIKLTKKNVVECSGWISGFNNRLFWFSCQ